MKKPAVIAAAVAGFALIVAGAAPATAAKDPDAFSFRFSDRYDCDGSLLMVHVSGEGRQTISPIAGTDQAFLGDSAFHIVESWNDRDNKQKYTADVVNSVVETSGTEVPVDDPEVVAAAEALNYEVIGPVFRFVSTQELRIELTRDDGETYLAADGTREVSSLFDTEGDGTPGGVLLDEETLSSEGVFSPEMDECEVADFVAAL